MASIDAIYTTKSHISGFDTKPSLLARARDLLVRYRRRSQERSLLAKLSERDMRELGMNRAQLEFEINKAFWED